MQHRNRPQEDRFVKSLYYAFGWSDLSGEKIDPYGFATWCALQVNVYTIKECLTNWLAFDPETQERHRQECMRLAFVDRGCKVLPL
jgi:hypothetical protein